MPVVTQAEVFSRIFDQEGRALSRDAARSIVQLDFRSEDRERMNLLAAKARQGKLSKQEDEELETYIHVGRLLAIMQSKARQFLRRKIKAT